MTNPKHRTATFALVAGSLLAACGSSAEPGEPVPLEHLADELLAAQCKLLVQCHAVSDEEFCLSYLGTLTANVAPASTQQLVGAVNAGKAKYDGVRARACIDGVAHLACEQVRMFGRTADRSGCEKVFTGTVADGAACAGDVECTTGSFCDANPQADAAICAGVCVRGGVACNADSHCHSGQICDFSRPLSQGRGICVSPQPPGGANSPCGEAASCQAGLYCSHVAGATTCKPLAKAGQACEVLGCADGLLCVTSADGSAPTCMAAASKGQPCLSSSQCGGSLLSSTVCDPTSHVCVDAPSSGPCASDSVVGCNIVTSYCDKSGATPTCRPFTPVGQPCDTMSLQCGFTGVECRPTSGDGTTGVCVLPVTCNG